MKIAVASDLHLEFGDLDFENTNHAQVLILSGDICTVSDLVQVPTLPFLQIIVVIDITNSSNDVALGSRM